MEELAPIGVVVFLIWLFGWGMESKFRYEIQYGSGSKLDHIYVDKEPSDCDFFRAPIGRKDCSYKKKILITTYAKDVTSGRSIYSLDDGETWQWNDGGQNEGKEIYVRWQKKID